MEISTAIRLCVLAGGASLLIWKRRELDEGIRAAIDRFRGGPPTPMHPSPAGDDLLLRRKPRRSA